MNITGVDDSGRLHDCDLTYGICENQIGTGYSCSCQAGSEDVNGDGTVCQGS